MQLSNLELVHDVGCELYIRKFSLSLYCRDHEKMRLIVLLVLIFGWICNEGVFSSQRPPIPSGSVGQPCHVNYKVYVYPLPPSLLERQEAARRNLTYHVCQKCIFEQFALEYIIFDYFTQFCGRTYNPEEADYFYLPIIRDLDYRIALNGKGGRAPSPTELALLAVMEQKNFTLWEQVFQVPKDYYQRHDGADHILVMPAPVTNFRHQSNMRGFFHYVSFTISFLLFINIFMIKFIEFRRCLNLLHQYFSMSNIHVVLSKNILSAVNRKIWLCHILQQMQNFS